jgi:galactokinase
VTDFAARLTRYGLSTPGFFVPGRIEVLGKHTDYAGGRSLLCAMDRGILMSFAPRSDSSVRVTDLARGETREVKIDPGIDVPRGDWSNYVATVVRRVARDFPQAKRGVDIRFASDLPVASGMSSSSALVIAIFLALDAVNAISSSAPYRAMITSPVALAAYLAAAENGLPFGDQPGDVGVGTFGGSEDHTAILCCRAGFLSRYSFNPTRSEGDIPFPDDKTFAIAFTGIAAEKAGSALAAYNEASLAVRRILELWNRATGRADQSLAGAIESDPDASEQICRLLGDATEPDFTSRRLRERFDHFVLESQELVTRASDAFARGDLAAFGVLVKSSQEAAESLLRNQIPETTALVKQARQEGAYAASAFGAGFGGSVWALVDTTDAERFLTAWSTSYKRAFPEPAARSTFFLTRPGSGARPV